MATSDLDRWGAVDVGGPLRAFEHGHLRHHGQIVGAQLRGGPDAAAAAARGQRVRLLAQLEQEAQPERHVREVAGDRVDQRAVPGDVRHLQHSRPGTSFGDECGVGLGARDTAQRNRLTDLPPAYGPGQFGPSPRSPQAPISSGHPSVPGDTVRPTTHSTGEPP